ncbi:hypothetical protein D3C72_1464150 [compost metagenome]
MTKHGRGLQTKLAVYVLAFVGVGQRVSCLVQDGLGKADLPKMLKRFYAGLRGESCLRQDEPGAPSTNVGDELFRCAEFAGIIRVRNPTAGWGKETLVCRGIAFAVLHINC